MSKQETLGQIEALGLIAVVRAPSPNLAVKMAGALVAGGVGAIEVAYSTPNAEWVVEQLAQQHGGGLLLGMGTLTDPRQAVLAKASGARFVSSPICEPALLKAMVASELLAIAGALTPTEVIGAHRLGADIVMLFPGTAAGPRYLRALAGPFPYVRIMPAGGVHAADLPDWFAAGAVAVAAGSELCPPALAKAGEFDEITRRASAFVEAVRSARGG